MTLLDLQGINSIRTYIKLQNVSALFSLSGGKPDIKQCKTENQLLKKKIKGG